MTTATIAETSSALSADRCDRCGAAATTRATLRGGGELMFCGHHTRVHASHLRSVGAILGQLPAQDFPS